MTTFTEQLSTALLDAITLKYNENHDEQGRFSSGDGGGESSGSSSGSGFESGHLPKDSYTLPDGTKSYLGKAERARQQQKYSKMTKPQLNRNKSIHEASIDAARQLDLSGEHHPTGGSYGIASRQHAEHVELIDAALSKKK